jgi:hypothetical protein
MYLTITMKYQSSVEWFPWLKSKQKGFNLNIPRYIDNTEPEDLQNIDAHLNGGIPNDDDIKCATKLLRRSIRI